MRDELLTLWFADETRKKWFERDLAFDEDLRGQFEQEAEAAGRGERDYWQQTPQGSLALILLLDQLPRNIWRGTPKAFAFDQKARKIADLAIQLGHDEQTEADRRLFFYLPFEHSEDLADQERAITLFKSLGNPDQLMWAERHHVIIERFGRFPHRNAVLGRESTADELAFLREPNSSF